jgi:hypothetical protein
MMMKRRRHRGYVLIVTLGLLVLAATMLVSLGRATMRRGAEARESLEELQHRWGVVSCRKAILPSAEAILARLEREQKKAVPVYRASVRLGGQAFDVIVSDEQAKANVNLLLERGDRSAAQSELTRALSGTGFGGAVRLRPLVDVKRPAQPKATTGPGTRPATMPLVRGIESYGQVFDGVDPKMLIEGRGLQAPAELVTCWGNGAINVSRASALSLKLAAGDSASQAALDQALRARDQVYRESQRAGAVQDAIKKVNFSDGEGQRRQMAWTTESKCHSLWIVTRTKQREYYYLVVRDAGEAAQVTEAAFVW